MVYFIYIFLFIIYLAIIKIEKLIILLKIAYSHISKNYVAGLFGSLGISMLADKIDYVIYWDLNKIKSLWLSIFFGIIFILIGMAFFSEKEK